LIDIKIYKSYALLKLFYFVLASNLTRMLG
jgi:hypothetical protein